ncbi:MAG: hypothetical protein IPL61_15810 [Myxococcales bacterium]|nr:hypothetical protein [Myxococcales bacterium]
MRVALVMHAGMKSLVALTVVPVVTGGGDRHERVGLGAQVCSLGPDAEAQSVVERIVDRAVAVVVEPVAAGRAHRPAWAVVGLVVVVGAGAARIGSGSPGSRRRRRRRRRSVPSRRTSIIAGPRHRAPTPQVK